MHTLKVNEGSDNLEMLITRHSQFATAVNVMNIYGMVETRSCKEKIEERWAAILTHVKKIEANNELLVIVGDLNAHVGSLIEGNYEKMSHGGTLLSEFLATGDYILVNGSSKASGGPYTRVDLGNNKKSALDLCIVSKGLYKYIDSFTIDKDRHFTPYRSASKTPVKYTDHFLS